jgi:transcription elongation GreA/GreB family factor
MRNTVEERELDDMKQIENFLVGLGSICNSSPSAQHLIYSKNGDAVMIKNNNKEQR